MFARPGHLSVSACRFRGGRQRQAILKCETDSNLGASLATPLFPGRRSVRKMCIELHFPLEPAVEIFSSALAHKMLS
jgi:hypothetical protein